ncbi:diguanylate cyclase/phosphodiesterase (GGDEF & EAL domains) with PAS/PAC sensor(s) [Methylophaga frappieri]|uniref:diguanylate cyclase n=2 Tax=Methylophaga frappieri (strain ATCC BAA-2434 / DSM 25690 / JAM7) TaxID=754477 RepID=I1YHB6_METFJ|nr:diguanylate cyclase/phosphodiesterase (GGDEF & EAL domains) with PAS/PAC sensor(s) [Methylophaga frappieri]
MLTTEQAEFLQKMPQIRLCADPDWLPYDGIDKKGQHIGIMAGFHQLWAEKLGVKIHLVPTVSWQQSLDYLRDGQCDVLSSAMDLPARRNYMVVTRPFVFYPFAIATQPGKDFIVDLSQALDETFAVVEGYSVVDVLRQHHPDVTVYPVDSPREGLKLVETGRVYGYIDTVPTIHYQMLRHGISHLKISGILEQEYAMSVGVSRQLPVLRDIYNAVISETSETERQEILKSWISVNYTVPKPWFWLWILLSGIAVLTAILSYRYWHVHRHNQRLQSINNHLIHLSHNDQLTGIANRYRLHQLFQREMEYVKAQGKTFSVLMVDVDYFKKINDIYGHGVGDNVICEVARLLESLLRSQDVVGRWGGEEFLILCPQTGLSGASKLAEDIRHQIKTHQFSISESVTISAGISEYQPGELVEQCIERADQALYQAKTKGRNRTIALSPQDITSS